MSKIYEMKDGRYDLEGDGQALYDLVYADRSEKNKLDLYLPNEKKEKYPVVVFVHGGAFFKSDKGRHLSNILNVLPMGYAAAAINFRLNDEAAYPEIRRDAIDAFNYLSRREDIDEEKIIFWGESHGALMSDDIVVNHADELQFRPAGVISFYGPVDLSYYRPWQEENGTVVYVNGKDNDLDIFKCTLEELPGELAKIDILGNIREGLPPFYLLHGLHDDNIPVEISRRFDKKLTEKGVPHDLNVVSDGYHGIDYYMDEIHNTPVMDFVERVFTGQLQ